MSVEINMDAVVQQSVQQLGAQNASLLLELNAQRAAVAVLEEQNSELKEKLESSEATIEEFGGRPQVTAA